MEQNIYYEVPMQGLPCPQDCFVSRKINLKWGLRYIKEEDIINFQFI